MSGFRWEIEAFAGPAREAIIGGTRMLVRVRLFNSPYASDLHTSPPTEPDAWTDLRPGAARDLAFELLAAAEHTDILTARAGHCEHER